MRFFSAVGFLFAYFIAFYFFILVMYLQRAAESAENESFFVGTALGHTNSKSTTANKLPNQGMMLLLVSPNADRIVKETVPQATTFSHAMQADEARAQQRDRGLLCT